MRFSDIFLAGSIALVLLLGGAACAPSAKAEPNLSPNPTTASVLAADQALSHAIRDNDAPGIARWLDQDWAVVSTTGGVGEGPSVFPDGIKSGALTRKTFETSEPRVRVHGDMALVTTMVKTSGVLRGKQFDVKERQTDVWLSKDGGWKCVFTHETKIPA